MTATHTEQAFETNVESMLLDGGWRAGDLAEWDVDRALFPARAVAFIRDTQPDAWEHVAAILGGDIEERIVTTLARELDTKGSLEVLRHGFRFFGRTFRVAYFAPTHGLNPDALARFERNVLTVTRQAPCHPGKGDTLDLVFALNGVPVATCELKNPMTGQTWRDAVRQYQQDRDPNAPLFRFKRRALVHFAADPDEVHMATRLAGDVTRFLPFNRGSNPGAVHCGAGNPANPDGYHSDYFWREVLDRQRFLDILGSYVFLETREDKVEDAKGARTEQRETMIFPRYHQLDAVHRLVATARDDGPGRNYLIQHSAGSGKTNSISWLSHRLASLHNAANEKVFDCVVVITDRRVLDRQLQDAIYQIEHAQGVVKAIDENSQQLAEALVDGTLILITTIQKFPFLMKGLLLVAGADSADAPSEDDLAQAAEWRKAIAARRYAVIVDEAHSSQTGESAREMKAVIGSRYQAALDAAENEQDILNAVAESHGPQPNLSFFAFTATPKGKTIELFGRPGPSGAPEPFHVYSMRQAIEEGFILDVLKHYIDYDTYFRIVKRADDDPKLLKRRTSVALAKFLSLHPVNVSQRTEVIVEHFREHVRHHMDGRAKAMVVTSSRLSAVRYMQAFERYIAEHGYEGEVRPLVAFSGTVTDPDTGEEFTEPGMNVDVVTGRSISEAALPGRFASPDYQILLVAEKYQTGFDQRLLQAMYVDKRLDGVQAVQTLSRLNRIAPGKAPPFVLDFVNDPEDIHAAFAPYYDQTQLQEASDPYRLEELKHELDGMQVYHQAELEAFAQFFYLPVAKRRPDDHARMETQLQPAAGRFADLDEEEQTAFRDRLSAFVNLYAFLSQIIPYADTDLEGLSSFGRLLLPHLRADRGEAVHLGSDVELEYYRLQRISQGEMMFAEGSAVYVTGPGEVGTGDPEEEKAPLSEIIARLNKRFGTDFTDEDRLFLEQVKERAVRNDDVRRMAQANTYDKFALGFRPQLGKLMVERMGENDAIVTRFLDDADFQQTASEVLAREVYAAVGEPAGDPSA